MNYSFNQKGQDMKSKTLRRMADTLELKIHASRRPMSQRATPKRTCQYRYRLADADNMERTQRAMRAIADAMDSGTLPGELCHLKSTAQVALLVRKGIDSSGGYYECVPLKHFADTSDAGRILQGMISQEDQEQIANRAERDKQQAIDVAEDKVRFAKLPGFFPTPPEIIERMIEAARLEDRDSILDPSAGNGAILDAVSRIGSTPNMGFSIEGVEIRPSLCNILDLKGHTNHQGDFLDVRVWSELGKFSVILMNPPFEKFQDIDHVMRAAALLLEHGTLVAIMSESTFTSTYRKPRVFREWLAKRAGIIESLPANSFKGIDSFRQTGVACRMVTITI